VNTRITVILIGGVLVAVSAYFIISEPTPIEPVAAPPAMQVETPLIELLAEQQLAPVETPKPIAAVVDTKVIAPSTLDGSDIKVMLAVADISTDLAQWLVPEEQIRKWVLFIDNAANGDLIAKHRPWQYSMKPLVVATLGKKEYLAPSNYQRAKPLLTAVMSIPPEKLADYYYSWSPLLEKAYRELGKAGSFDTRFNQAIDKVLAAKSLPAEPELKLPSVMYQYQDKSLETASDIDKLIWRLGFENTNDIQQYLRDLKSRL
jgi:hypothetical protein